MKREECDRDWCEGLDRLRDDFAEHRRELRADYSRHSMFVGALVSIFAVAFGAMTQWQIARMNKAPTQPAPYIFAVK
jgi:hypothetical protein